MRGRALPHSARAPPPFPGPRALPALKPARPRDLVGCSCHSASVSPPCSSLLGLRFRGCSWELEKLWASENAGGRGLALSPEGLVDGWSRARGAPLSSETLAHRWHLVIHRHPTPLPPTPSTLALDRTALSGGVAPEQLDAGVVCSEAPFRVVSCVLYNNNKERVLSTGSANSHMISKKSPTIKFGRHGEGQFSRWWQIILNVERLQSVLSSHAGFGATFN